MVNPSHGDENPRRAPVTQAAKDAPGRKHRRWLRDIAIGVVASLLATLLVAVGSWIARDPSKGSLPASSIVGMSGGCSAFQVYAQNRWPPYGTAIRAAPSVLSTQVGGFPPNMSIAVNGWLHGRAAFQLNVTPFNSDVWFHLADGAGWVSFGGVREQPTSQDPGGLGSGGPPAPTPDACRGAIQ